MFGFLTSMSPCTLIPRESFFHFDLHKCIVKMAINRLTDWVIIFGLVYFCKTGTDKHCIDNKLASAQQVHWARNKWKQLPTGKHTIHKIWRIHEITYLLIFIPVKKHSLHFPVTLRSSHSPDQLEVETLCKTEIKQKVIIGSSMSHRHLKFIRSFNSQTSYMFWIYMILNLMTATCWISKVNTTNDWGSCGTLQKLFGAFHR